MLLASKLFTMMCFSFIYLFLLSNTSTTAHAAEIPSDVSLEAATILEENNSFYILITPKFNHQEKQLVIDTPQFEKIVIDNLKSQIGAKNVLSDQENKKIILNLTDYKQESFHIKAQNTNILDLHITDTQKNDLFSNHFVSWEKRSNLKVSYGNEIKQQSDGSVLKPALYFGSINNAIANKSLADSVKRFDYHSSRANNITAANSAIVSLASTHNPLGTKNQHFTNTSGDGVIIKNGKKVIDNSQSLNNFVTTNLYNYRNSKNNLRPNIIGPDYNISDNNFNTGLSKNSYHFFTRISPETHLEEQRLTFEQQYLNSRWFSKDQLYKVRIQITQRFTSDNQVQTEMEFKNIGNQDLNNFTGYLFKNIHFNQADSPSSFVSNHAPIYLSEGGKGIISKDDTIGSTLQVDLNEGEHAPFAWTIGKDKPTYFGNDGYPWGSGNSFQDIASINGNTQLNPGEPYPDKNGKTLIMHTQNRQLKLQESVKMNFSTKLKVEPKLHPHLTLKDADNESNPQEVDNAEEHFTLHGTWLDYTNKNAELFYTIDDSDLDHAQPLLDLEQHDKDREQGTQHDWQHNIPIHDLKHGKHTVRVFAKSSLPDHEGKMTEHRSNVYKTTFKINSIASSTPGIEILKPTPNSFIHIPYKIFSDTLTLSGIWHDLDSKNVKLSYSFDDGEKTIFSKNEANKAFGRENKWVLNDFSVAKYTDSDSHWLTISVEDEKGQTSEDTFFFQYEKGYFEIIKPDEIDFGTVHITHKDQFTSNANLQGQLIVNDHRTNKKRPITLSLITNELIHVNSEEDVSYKLKSALKYDDQFIPSGGNLIIGKTKTNSDPETPISTNFTKDINKKLFLKFKLPYSALNTISKTHKFSSTWTFSGTDSV